MRRESMASVVGLLAAWAFAVYGLGPNGALVRGGAAAPLPEAAPPAPTLVPAPAPASETAPPPSAAAPEAELPQAGLAPDEGTPPGIDETREWTLEELGTEVSKVMMARFGIASKDDMSRQKTRQDAFRVTHLVGYAYGLYHGLEEHLEREGGKCAFSGFDPDRALAYQNGIALLRIRDEDGRPEETRYSGMRYTVGRKTAYMHAIGWGMDDIQRACRVGRFEESRGALTARYSEG